MNNNTAMDASLALRNFQLLVEQQKRMMLEEKLGFRHTQPAHAGQVLSNAVPGPVSFRAQSQHKHKVAPRSHPAKQPKPASAVPKPSPQEDVQKEYDDLVSGTDRRFSTSHSSHRLSCIGDQQLLCGGWSACIKSVPCVSNVSLIGISLPSPALSPMCPGYWRRSGPCLLRSGDI